MTGRTKFILVGLGAFLLVVFAARVVYVFQSKNEIIDIVKNGSHGAFERWKRNLESRNYQGLYEGTTSAVQRKVSADTWRTHIESNPDLAARSSEVIYTETTDAGKLLAWVFGLADEQDVASLIFQAKPRQIPPNATADAQQVPAIVDQATVFILVTNLSPFRVINKLLTLVLLSFQTAKEDKLSPEVRAEVYKLRELVDRGSRDIEIERVVIRLKLLVFAKDVPSLKDYALDKEAMPIRGPIAFVFVERGNFDEAAHVMLQALSEVKGNRSYVMWKGWEFRYGKRPDYKQFTKQLTDSFLKQYEKGSKEYRETIAEIFGKGPNEAKFSLQDFKKAIHYPD